MAVCRVCYFLAHGVKSVPAHKLFFSYKMKEKKKKLPENSMLSVSIWQYKPINLSWGKLDMAEYEKVSFRPNLDRPIQTQHAVAVLKGKF